MYFIVTPCLFMTFNNNITREFLQSTMLNFYLNMYLFEYIFISVSICIQLNIYSFECIERFSNFYYKDLRHKSDFEEN